MVEVKVISYNVHSCVGSDWNYSIDRIGDVLASQEPDVCCLQEIEANRSPQQTRVWSSVHSSHQPRELASSLSFEHCQFAPAIRSIASSRYSEAHDVPDADGGFGVATLSRHPILEVRRHTFDRYGKKTLRNALACLISLPNGAKVWVVNTHLGCHWGGEQYQQARELARFIDSLGPSSPKAGGPEDVAGVILCGDFNSLPFFRSVKVMKSFGLIDTWGAKGVGSGCTFPADGKMPGLPRWCCRNRPVLRLDYIFVKSSDTCQEGHLVVKCAFVVKDEENNTSVELVASDHLPLCTIFEIWGPS